MSAIHFQTLDDLRTTFQLPVSVYFKYDHLARKTIVKRILWQGENYKVRQRGPSVVQHSPRGGTQRVFICRSQGGMQFAVALRYDTLQWTLLEARNFMGDVVE